MSEIRVAEADESEAGAYLVERFPPWMPTHRATGNFKLMDTAGRAIDRLDADIEAVDRATTVQTADSVTQLEKLGRMVDLPPKQDEPIEKYRTRLMAEFQLLTNEATIRDILVNISELLGISVERIGFSKESHGTIVISVPGDALDDLDISSSQFVQIIGKQTAAGFEVDAFKRGTFTYITPTDYQDGNHDATIGYDGLDSNDEPKDTGGTYAGLLD